MSEEFTVPSKIVLIIIITTLIAGVSTFFITKDITEKKILEESEERFSQGMNIAYAQCAQLCAPKIPAFVNIINGTAQCMCLEINDGNTTSNSTIPT